MADQLSKSVLTKPQLVLYRVIWNTQSQCYKTGLQGFTVACWDFTGKRVLAPQRMKTNADYTLSRKDGHSKNHNLESYEDEIQTMNSTNILQEIHRPEKKNHGFFDNSCITSSRGRVNQFLFLKPTSHWSTYTIKLLIITITEMSFVSFTFPYMETAISLQKKWHICVPHHIS